MATALDRMSRVKKCAVCKQIKPISEFPTHNTSKDGHMRRCNACYRKQHLATREQVQAVFVSGAIEPMPRYRWKAVAEGLSYYDALELAAIQQRQGHIVQVRGPETWAVEIVVERERIK